MAEEHKSIHQTNIQINAYECDFNQALKPYAFFQHLSQVAGVHATQLGVGFEAFQARNLFWVHSRMKIRFLRFPRLGDVITVRTWPKTIQQKLFFIRDFEILDSDGQHLAAATSAWLIIDATTRRLVPPRSIELSLPTRSDRSGLDEPLERLHLADNGEERLRVRAGYSAVDPLGHVNNSRYVEWICDSFPIETFRRHKLDWLQINYDHEVLPGEEVAVLANPVAEESGLWALAGQNRSNGTRAFEAALRWQD